MERRGFLRSLGMLAASSLIPKSALLIIEKIEEKSSQRKPYELIGVSDECKNTWVNHMTIQRKTATVSADKPHTWE